MSNPFPELAPYAEPRRVVPRGEMEGWLAEEMRKERDQEVKRTIVTAPPPDQVARETRLAREANVPPAMVEGRLDEVERARNAERLTALAERYPAIGKFTSLNPRAAVAAQDDTEALGIFGSAWDMLTKVPARLGGSGGFSVAGMVGEVYNTIEETNEFLGTPVAAAMDALGFDVRGARRSAEQTREQRRAYFREGAEDIRERNRGSNFVTEGLLQGTETALLTLGAVATRSPSAAASIMGGLVGTQSSADARDMGLDAGQSVRYGLTQGLIEGGTERIPAGTLVEMIVKRTPFGKAFVRELGQEMGGEQAATFLQDANDYASLPEHAGKTFGDFLATREEAALQTGLGVVGGVTVTTASIRAAQRTADAAAKVVDRVGQAQQARQEAAAFNKFAKGREISKLRNRDPEAFRELMRVQAEEAGATNIYISPDAIREYQQSDSYDQDNDPFDAERFAEAEATGGDYVIPVADLLTDVVGTPAWEAVKDAVRLSGGGMSPREAVQFEESIGEIMAEAADGFAEQDRKASKGRSVREKLVDQVATAFGVSFGSRAARDIAEVFVQAESAWASRMGRELSEDAVEGFEVRQVMPEGVAQAVKADSLDLVINAMRVGKDAVAEPTIEDRLAAVAEAAGFPIEQLRENYAMWTERDGEEAALELLQAKEAELSVAAKGGSDPMRAAADDLRAMLSEAGYSPDEMSDAEVRSVVEQMSERDAREGFEQERRAFYQGSATLTGQNAGSGYMVIRDVQAETPQSEETDAGSAAEESAVEGAGDAARFGNQEEQAELFPGADLGLDPNFFGSTIEVDGVDRPTLNANDEPIASTAEAIRNFWRWFGDSKMVDEDGRPVVFYHGTRANLSDGLRNFAFSLDHTSTFFFAVDRTTAEGFQSKEGGVIPAYLRAENIDEYNAEGRDWGRVVDIEWEAVQDAREAWIGDQLREFAPASTVEQIEGIWILQNNLDGESARFTNEGEAMAELEEVEDREREQRREELVEEADDLYEGELHELGYLESEGYSTDYLAAEAMGRFDAVVIDDVDEGSGSTTVAIILAQPNAIKSTENKGTFDPDDPRILFQREFAESARGRIIFDQNRRIIEMFAGRNLSTPIHEFSHMWLERLSIYGAMKDSPADIQDMWEKTKRWFAANGHAVGEDGVIPTEAHEMFARAGERYVMEGKAPTTGLQRIFETFRNALVSIYRTVESLRAPITPEIREVFDRLLATDEEIAAARERQNLAALFKDAASIGMSQTEFAAYQSEADAATGEAHAKLLDKAMRTIRQREQKRYAEARKAIRAEEQERIDNAPLHKAIRLMRDMRVSKSWIVDEMGEDALRLLPVRVPPLYSDGGVDPNIVAELAGYGGARDMIEALIGAERAHREAKEGGDKRGMRERAIETATDAEFARRYGDPFSDGTIEQEAMAAVYSERQGELMASEIRVLGRKTGQRPTPWRMARDWARGKIRAGSWAEEASPSAIQRYARNAAKAQRAAEDAFIAQDFAEAYRQKQFAMLNTALVSEAKNAAEEIESAVKRMEKIAGRRTMKSVDQDYLEQAHALLEAVDLKRRSQAGIDKQGKWETWAEARRAEGYDVVTPPGFEATLGATNWSRLPIDTLMTLDEAVKQVMHLGRLKQTLLDNAEEREWEEVVGEAEASADGIGRKPPRGSFTDPSWWESIKSRAATMDAALLKMEQVFDWLDQGKSNGVFNRIVFRPIADAQAREQDMTRDYFARVREALEAVPADAIRHWGDKITLDLIDPETGLPAVFERKKLVAMALNWGNAGNRQRLADGYGWSPEGIERALMGNLTEAEWAFVQQTWDIIDTLWPEIEKMERAINGVAPEKVEAVEVVTPFGTMRGGYYPAIYDTTLDYTAEEQAGRRADLFEANYVRATTRASATKERAEKVSRPILLDVGVINRHLGEVIHDVTHREAVMKAHRFLTNRRVMKAVDETLGPEVRKQFRPWLQHVANSWAQDRAGNEGLGKLMSKARANTTVVGMGWRFTTMLTQLAGYSNSFERVGAKWVSVAIAQSAAHPIETFDFVMSRSGEMRGRMDTIDRDIRREMRRIESKIGAASEGLTAAKRFAFHGIGYMDRVVSIPTWIGAYNKALSQGMTEEEAGYEGDKAIRLSQGAAGPKDLAAVATGQGRYGEAFKWLTMFYSYLSTVYSRQRNLGRDTRRAGAGDLPALMARAWWLIVVPPLLAELLSGRGPDDDEDPAWWAFKKMLSQSLGAIPGVRDVAEPVLAELTGGFAFGYRLSPVQAAGESVVKVAKDAGRIYRGEETKRATRNVLEMVGYATGLVPGQLAASVQFLVDVGSDDADPETISDWYTGLTKGRMSD